MFILGIVTIPGGMTFTVDSDLNGASSQFTLTCISTGGPATTVTWTRDSDTVTDGTETVLDNRTTSQYTHTLTVTGGSGMGGLYTCTVANDKPSGDSATYTVQGTSDTVLQLYMYVSQCLRDHCLYLSVAYTFRMTMLMTYFLDTVSLYEGTDGFGATRSRLL